MKEKVKLYNLQRPNCSHQFVEICGGRSRDGETGRKVKVKKMNLFKVYSALAIFLVLCTYSAEGGILLLLILKIIALKGALFFGFPLAIGSYILGQGVGFLGGTAVGGFGALHAVVKYHKKHQRPHGWGWPGHHPAHPAHHHHGWGWSSRLSSWKPAESGAYSAGWGGWSPVPTTKRPGFLASVRNRIFDHILGSGSKASPEIHVVHQGWPGAGESGWAEGKPGWISGGQNPANTYYDTHSVVDDGTSYVHHEHEESDSGKHGASESVGSYAGGGGVDYTQGLMNYLKTQQSSGGADLDASYGVPEVAPSSQYESGSVGTQHGEPADIYGSPGQADAAYGAPQGSANPELYDVNGGAGNLGTYNYHTEPSASDNLGYGGLDSALQGSEESVAKIRAPNSVIQSYLEKKLKEEMTHQKNAAQKKEAAELIAMLRQAYIQELVESLNDKGPQTGRKARTHFRGTTELPDFVPFPSEYVPNSTTARPKRPRYITLPNGQKRGVEQAGEKRRHVRIIPETQRNNETGVGNATRNAVPTAATPTAEVPTAEVPTRFVPMKTAFVLNKRSGSFASGATSRNRRQAAADIQALTTFADDIKKFFLLVSVLDQDKCLQKLVCEVHAKTGEAATKLTPYESNILVTFKVMNVLLPANSEDSTTHYRAAAKIGELSKSTEICSKAYASCTFSSSEIVNMGNQVAATGNVEAVTTTVKSVLADLEPSDADEAESAPVPSYARPISMPQV